MACTTSAALLGTHLGTTATATARVGARGKAAAPLRRLRTVAAASSAGGFVVRAAAEAPDSVQLGTAKLPAGVDEEVFCRAMFQWANSLCHSGQNMPFALPQRVDMLESGNGFSMAFLTSDPRAPGTFSSVGEIVASVEDGAAGVRVLMIRGTGKVAQKGALVDVPMVMQTMPGAIKNAIFGSMP
eukprot:CAMPEP_0197578512 /NCGR_PEP_ID=MMETSP1326-20131121/2689_1 /TAXON_ID=1155430 /ORGANISM="Genus nov. species nov., Strain RCC2288" /LENGTH=184 /DNA_ID=CAMNT_0043141697 /DNA_START=157 /DNA_END=711 /DNA_ORIENTATION=-